MDNRTKALVIPPSNEIMRRIQECRIELKALSRLLRMSRAAETADEAKRARPNIEVPTRRSRQPEVIQFFK
jgi:hypothetical protein